MQPGYPAGSFSIAPSVTIWVRARGSLVSALCLLLLACSSSSQMYFAQTTSDDDFLQGDFRAYMRAASERPLPRSSAYPIYRVLWRRAFHDAVVFRIECPSECSMYTSVLSLQRTRSELPRIKSSTRKVLTAVQRAELVGRLSKVDLKSPQPKSDTIFTDGSTWALESASPDGYGAWVVQTPHSNPPYAAYARLCDYVVELSGVQIPEDEYY